MFFKNNPTQVCIIGEYENAATFISKVTALCVGATRFELATSRSLTGRSTKLSHAPKTFVRA